MTRRTPAVGLLVAGLLLTGCGGVPGDGHVRVVDPGQVPYHLLDDGTPTPSAASTDESAADGPRLFWLDADDRLVGTASDVACGRDSAAVVADLLDRLAAGARDADVAKGLGSALPPETTLRLVRIAGATAQVEIGAAQAVGSDRLPLAVAQIVLTVTSVSGVGFVTLARAGTPLQVPLPGGQLTSRPLDVADYRSLIGSVPAQLAGPALSPAC